MSKSTTHRMLLAAAAMLLPVLAGAQQVIPSLFRVVGPRDEVIIGVAPDGAGPDGAERLARRLVADGQLGAWQYAVGRAPDGSTRFAATKRIAILRNDALRIEPYAAAIPVFPLPVP